MSSKGPTKNVYTFGFDVLVVLTTPGLPKDTTPYQALLRVQSRETEVSNLRKKVWACKVSKVSSY